MKTMEDVKRLLADFALADYADAMRGAVKSAVHMQLQPADDGTLAIGTSKMGGMPDLPAGTPWPLHAETGEPLSFLCQFRFADVKPFDGGNKLPTEGMLYFFYDCTPDGMPWGFDPNDGAGKAVLYYNGGTAQLARRTAPAALPAECIFGAAALQFETALEIPNCESGAVQPLALSEDDRDSYWDMTDALYDAPDGLYAGAVNKLLGHSDNLQGNMELECELVTNGLFCGDASGYTEGRERGLHQNTAHWTLLLQIDSNEDIGMMWGDCGKLYLWITQEDLAAKAFEKSWLILQCG